MRLLAVGLTLAFGAGVALGQGNVAPMNLESASHSDAKVWATKTASAGAPTESVHARIVDNGNDLVRGGDGAPRHHFYCDRYVLTQNKDTGLWAPVDKPVQLDADVDLDGDGQRDDVVAYHEFSLERPFSPVTPWYDTLAGSPRWYGGQAIYQANARTSSFSEDGVNQDHDGQFAWPRDNWSVFHENYDVYSPYRLAINWLWLKHDFLNGGARGKVTFDAQSRLALVLKRYFMGVDSVRFLVRDGEQCYLSEATFQYEATHTLSPTKTNWAKYDPKAPYDIYFDTSKATFEPHVFQDISGVGVYCSKDKFLPGYFGYKWYAFECDAVVQRPKRPSENLAMAPVAGSNGVADFYIGTTEVPYDLWKTVFRQARSNDFVPPSQGFGFEKDGDMGSMAFGAKAHSLQEPATNFTLHDAAAWCNALSELESRTPAYYEDAEFKKPLHEVRMSPAFLKPHPLPKLYVRWDADGYRLPTVSEWQAAYTADGTSRIADSADSAWTERNSDGATHPVGSKKPGKLGLNDLLGNVWELAWTFGDVYDPQKAVPITVLGGDFLSPSDPAKHSANPYGDRPHEGGYNIGLRLVRRETGGKGPAEAKPLVDVPVWTIAADLVTKGGEAPAKPDAKPEMVVVPDAQVEMAKYETTYALWKQVRDWAVTHGYQTDYDGDMGSMAYWGFDPVSGWAEPPQTHRPDEPVTNITFYDMAVWCNALSEILGRKPVYFADQELKEPYKTAVKYRPVQCQFAAEFVEKYGKPETEDTPSFAMGAGAGMSPRGAFAVDAPERVLPSLYTDPNADGFRLPTLEEFTQAALPGNGKYPWGNDPAGVFDNDWLFDNAWGTTHPVGQKKPCELGLCDILGNVSELTTANPGGRGQTKVQRFGGSFGDLTLGLTRGVRNSDQPPATWPYCDTGFRIVRQTPQKAASREEAPWLRPVQVASLDVDSGMLAPMREPEPAPQLLAQAAAKRRTAAASDADTKPSLDADSAKFDPLQGKVHRGNLYRTGEFQTTGVTAKPKIAWEFKTGGPVLSSPVVVEGVAYVGSCDGYVYAVDAASGHEVWKVQTGGPVTGSAAVVDGAVYIASEDGTLYALGVKDGQEIWSSRCGSRMAGSPAVAYGAVFIGGGNKGGRDEIDMSAGPIIALDVKTGKGIWRGEGGPQGITAISTDGRRLFNNSSDNYGALDIRTGKKVFSFDAGHQARAFASMTISGDFVYAPVAMRGAVVCLDANDKKVWQRATLPRNDEMEMNNGGVFGYEILGDLAVAQGRVFAGCNDGNLHAFDAKTGDSLWKAPTNGPVQSSPSVAGDTVYFGSWDGHLYAVNASDGKQRWKIKLGDMPQVPAEQYKLGGNEGGRVISSPWPGDGVVYVGCSNGTLYAVQ